ncbi:MAG: hypothetical protein JJU24_05185 [Natronohydrobacter sp.]|nr:hypothetical protein [Natronohydrobacter sp.]
MSAFLLDAARHIGAPLLTRVLERKIGGANTRLASEVIDAVARRAGVTPEGLEQVADEHPSRLVDAMRETEAMMPEMIALYAQGLEGQFALLQAEGKGPWWGSDCGGAAPAGKSGAQDA